MDVDIPQNEEAMETDSPINIEHQHPQLTRKDSIIDPDGDEVMQGDEDEVVHEDEDIEIGDGGEEIEAEEEYVEGEGDGDYDVDLEGGDDQGIGETQDESLDTEVGEGGVVPVDTGATTTAEDIPSALQDNTSTPAQTVETTAPLDHQISTETGVESAPVAPDAANPPAETNQEVAGSKVAHAADQKHTETDQREGDHHEEGDAAEEEEEGEEGEEGGEGEEGEEEGAEGEEEGAEYDLLTPETLPPIILNLSNSRVALFNTISTDPELPLWFSDRIGELCEATLSDLWCAIRFEVDVAGEGNEEDEMVVTEKLMDLKMGDVSLYFFCY
jgi:hypothetical protein